MSFNFGSLPPNLQKAAQVFAPVVPGLAAAGGTVALGGMAANRFLNPDDERLTDALIEGNPNYMQQRQLEQKISDPQFQQVLDQELENRVRLGQMDPMQAQQLKQQVGFDFDEPDSMAYGREDIGGLLGGQGTGENFNYQPQYGDPNALGLPTAEQFGAMEDFATAAGGLQQDLGDLAVSREFDRTMQYRRPIERDRNYEGFAMSEAQARNAQRRALANSLMNSYASTAAGLIGSGL